MSRSYSYVSPPIVFLASNILAYVASCKRVIGYRDLAVPLGVVSQHVVPIKSKASGGRQVVGG